MSQQPKIYRAFALPLAAFDYLKDFQREYEREHRVHLNNNQCLTLILEQHKAGNQAR